MNGLLLLHN